MGNTSKFGIILVCLIVSSYSFTSGQNRVKLRLIENESLLITHSFPNYLRFSPGIVSPRLPVPEHILRPDYVTTGCGTAKEVFMDAGSPTIPVLNHEDIKKMRVSCAIASDVLRIASAVAKPGSNCCAHWYHNALIYALRQA